MHPAEEANRSDAAATKDGGAGKNAAEVIQGAFRQLCRARRRAVVKIQDAWRVWQRSRSLYFADTLMHNLSTWRERGGGDLEPVLASGAIALVDAQWIISHAEAGGVLTHRQALPKEAFLSLADLVEASRASLGGLPVIALSCPWRTKQHPDPDGDTLRRVGSGLRALANDWYNRGQRFGVFWDFLSLHQHPDPAHRQVRTAEENRLFRQGLGCLGRLFAHPHTTVLRTASYPEGYDGRKWSAQHVRSLRDQCEGLPGPNLWRYTEARCSRLRCCWIERGPDHGLYYGCSLLPPRRAGRG